MNVIAVQRPYWYSLQLLNESSEEITLDDYLTKYKSQQPDEKIKSEDSEGTDLDLDIDFGQMNISELVHRTSVCSDETMMKHFNLNNP